MVQLLLHKEQLSIVQTFKNDKLMIAAMVVIDWFHHKLLSTHLTIFSLVHGRHAMTLVIILGMCDLK